MTGSPGTGLPGWAVTCGQVAGLLVAARAAETRDGAVLPAPLGGGVAFRAWDTATRSAPDDGRALEVVGRAARVLGTRVAAWRATGTDDPLAGPLRREAALHGCEPERLVAHVARVHGVLTAPDPAAAHTVWHAFDDAPSQASGSGPSIGSSWSEPSTAPGTSPPGSTSGS
ncbi:hypothetical protein ACR9E3_20410 [Actinomycetospora sp. C-140]